MSVSNIITDFTPIVHSLTLNDSGNANILDNCKVQLLVANSTSTALTYNSSGGRYGKGFLQTGSSDANSSSQWFNLKWNQANLGYQITPDAVGNVALVADDAQVLISGASLSTGNSWTYYKVNVTPNLKTVTITLNSTNNNWPVIVDSSTKNVGISNVSVGTALQVNFITLGTNAWKALLNAGTAQPSLVMACCSGSTSNYPNLTSVCSKYKGNCNSDAAQICGSDKTTNFGTKDGLCKAWCLQNPGACLSSIKLWCTKNNNPKGTCDCFNASAFKTFESQLRTACGGNCPISDFTSECFYPACLSSDYHPVAALGNTCPNNCVQACVNSIKNQGSISAQDVNNQCIQNINCPDSKVNVNANKNINQQGTGGPPPPTGGVAKTNFTSGNNGNVVSIITQSSSYWPEIVGVIVIILVIIVIVVVKKKKGKK